jgi:hypothetical protein
LIAISHSTALTSAVDHVLANNRQKILPKADHYQWKAKVGSNAEMASLQRVVPEYFTTIQDWLGKRIRGFRAYQ